MNAKILNREFQHPEDGWYHIEPKGRHPNRAAGVVQVIDDEACAAIVNRFNADAKAGKLSHGHEMLIDHEHFKHDTAKETLAYGWLTRLEKRADGYYGQIRWTHTGRQAVDGGDYRFFSTEYAPRDLQAVKTEPEPEGGKLKAVRPLRLDGLTLTNDPNNKGARPITNRGLASAPADGKCPECEGELQATAQAGLLHCPGCLVNFAGPRPAVNQPTKAITMKNTAMKLGLPAEASEEAILGAVTLLINRATTAEEQVAQITNRLVPLEAENQTLLAEQVDSLLEAYKVTDDKIRKQARPVLVSLKNRAERAAFLEDFGFKPGEGRPPTTRLLNRGGNPPSEPLPGEPDEKLTARIMNRARELMQETKTIQLPVAISLARRELMA